MDDIKTLDSKEWRLNNLYRIINKQGDSIPFKLNYVQSEVLKRLHTRNLILKARQVGMSTFSIIYLLDEVIFNNNFSGGIVSYSREHSQHIFSKVIGHALKTLKPHMQPLAERINQSATEIKFKNGSSLRVDTTLRGSAYQLVLVSEFGKTSARNPLKATEVVTGTLETVPDTGMIIIESTGEGDSGHYADMITTAYENRDNVLTSLDYKLHFFPWYTEPKYVLKAKVEYGIELTDYFRKLEKELDITLTQEQRNWYAKKAKILNKRIKQEYPSTIAESFSSSSEAYYFQEAIQNAKQNNRLLFNNIYDPIEPVYIAMDIGATDLTVIIFFQVVHGEIRIIDFYKDNNKSVPFYAKFLRQDKEYLYHTIALPHDAARKDGIIVENTYEREFRGLFSNTDVKFIVLPRTSKNINISNAIIKLDRCVFNMNRCKELVENLMKYRKKWSEQYGKYIDEPYHDISSHYGDSYIYAMQLVTQLEVGINHGAALKKHKEAVEARSKRLY